MGDDRSLARLLADAGAGGADAWDVLVDRYAGLVVAVCRRYGLDAADVNDVSQTVWLRLVEQLGSIREPEALPGWLVTTARNESFRVLRSGRRTVPTDMSVTILDAPADVELTAPDRGLLHAERDAALRAALAELPEHCQRLLALLLADPPPAYASISDRLGVPVGSIGPTRARCLDRLRRCPAVMALSGAAGLTQER